MVQENLRRKITFLFQYFSSEGYQLKTMQILRIIMSFLIVVCVQTTIDVNLPQLQYIADHLLPSECRKLVAALHDKSYEITLDVNATEQEIPFDQSCVKLLLHWNSQPGEGRGENHEILCRRLEQLGKSKLATWLSRTVYHQLSGELKESLLGDPFKELATNATANVTDYPDMILQEAKLDTNTGTTLDIFFYIIIFILASLLISLIAAAIWRGKSKAISKENNYVTRTFVPNPLKTNGNYIPLQDDTDFEN